VSRRATILLGGTAALALTVAGATAYACTNLAALNLSTSSGRAGDAIIVTGSGFSAGAAAGPMDDGMGDMAMGSPGMDMDTRNYTVRPAVVLHWNGADGPELGRAIPDKSGSISLQFTIPDAAPGHYTLMAVQKNAQGFDIYGTPARAAIQVVGLTGRPAADAVGPGAEGAAGAAGSGSAGPIVLTAILGVLSAGLLVGVGLTVRQLQRRRVPAVVRTGGRPPI
jgi:hypothetical protein